MADRKISSPVPEESGAGDASSRKRSRRSQAQRDARRAPWRKLFDAYEDLEGKPAGWRFEPLDVRNIEPPPEATIGRRIDGQGLIYPGMSHSFFGDADSMKTWLALFIVREAMASRDDRGHPDQSVVYLDCERNRRTFVRRMALIGADLETLHHTCAYFRVTMPLVSRHGVPTAGYKELDLALDYFRDAIVIIDGVTEFMGIHAWDVNSPTDVASYHALLLRRWPGARTTIEIDHTAKMQFGRRTQFGSQHKRAGIDGASYEVVKIAGNTPKVSVARVLLRKDNEDGIREHCDADEDGLAAVLRLDSTVEPAKFELLAPDSWGALPVETRKLTLGDRAAAVLADSDVEMTAADVLAAVNADGGAPAQLTGIRSALQNLRRAGAAESTTGFGGENRWSVPSR